LKINGLKQIQIKRRNWNRVPDLGIIISMKFQEKFESLKKLNLPPDQFIVVSSGALSIRGIRDSEDIDVIVTESLWNKMIKEYPVGVNSFGIQNLELENDIEILNPTQSIFGNSKIVPMNDIFEKADIFDGIKFINLDHLKMIKKELGREKDLRDISLIDDYLKTNAVAL